MVIVQIHPGRRAQAQGQRRRHAPVIEIDLVAAAQWYTIDALPGSVFVRRSELGHAIELEDPFGDLGEFIETGAKLLLIAEPLKRGNQVDGFYHA